MQSNRRVLKHMPIRHRLPNPPHPTAVSELTLAATLTVALQSAPARSLAAETARPAGSAAPVGHGDLDLGETVDASALEERAADDSRDGGA